MPLDPNIILSGKMPDIDPVGTAYKAMSMREMMQNSQIKQTEIDKTQNIKNALAGATTVDADGNVNFDHKKAVSNLSTVDPIAATQVQKQFQDQDLSNLKYQRDMADSLLSNVRHGPGVPPEITQNDWSNMRAMGIKANLPNAQNVPEIYPGESYFQSMMASHLNAKEQLENYQKNQGLAIDQQKANASTEEVSNKKQELQIERYKAFGGQPPGGAGATGATGGVQGGQVSDPSALVKNLVPPQHQQKVFDEIEAAQNTTQNASKILNAFDASAKEARPMSGGTGTSLSAINPWDSTANQKALHALMGPTFKDVEGTVRQAAMDNMNKNTTPQFGDSDRTIGIKRNALVGYLQSKSSAPTAKGFGIDLKNFPTTSFKTGPAVDADLGSMSNDDLRDYIKTHGG